LFLFISIPFLILILILPITVYLIFVLRKKKIKINSFGRPNQQNDLPSEELDKLLSDNPIEHDIKKIAATSQSTPNELELKKMRTTEIIFSNSSNGYLGDRNQQYNQIEDDIKIIKALTIRILKTLTDSKDKEISTVSKSKNLLNELNKTIETIEKLSKDENQSIEIIEYFKKKDVKGYTIKEELGSGSYGKVYKLEKNKEL
jgi:hypothetical protein